MTNKGDVCMKKIAYLTIDDGPSVNFIEKVDYLGSKKIPAIFFCRGDLIEKRQKDIVYAIEKGFIIGNHGYKHPHFSKIPLKECFERIIKTDRIIEEVYKKAKIKRPIKVFRFPYGDKGSNKILTRLGFNGKYKKLQKYLERLGYKQPKFEDITYKYFKKLNFDKDADVFWTYDVEEYRLKNLEEVFNKIEREKNLFNESSSEIILIHDQPRTAKIFPLIINHLLNKGIKFAKPKLK